MRRRDRSKMNLNVKCGGLNRDLCFRLNSVRNNYSTIEQLADHLRLSDPQYARLKRQPFHKRVQKIIEFLDRGVASDDDGDTPIRKKQRVVDELDEGQQTGFLNNSCISGGSATSSVAPACRAEGASSCSDEEGWMSVSAIAQQKLEPEIDLMKSILRERLSQKSMKLRDVTVAKKAAVLESVDNKDVKEKTELVSKRKRREVEQAVELEVVDDRDGKEVLPLINEQSELLGDGLSKINDIRGGKEVNGRMLMGLGGMDGVIEELMERVIFPFCHPHLPHKLGVKPITGILLHGPPGCGKTTLAEAIADETGVPFYKVCAAELVSGVSGASEENIRELFSKANRTAPSIVFIDEIDSIASKRENMRGGMEHRIVTQLLTCMDESRKLVKRVQNHAGSKPGYVLVIGATNRPDDLDHALRRPGRFDHEFLLGVPDERARFQILSKLLSNAKVDGVLDLIKIAGSTPGFVGADLESLVDMAGNLAMNRIICKRKVELSKEQKDGSRCEDYWRLPVTDEEEDNLSITMADLEDAVKRVQPSSKREGFSDIPDVKWDDVGGLCLLRKEFVRHIIRPIKFPKSCKKHRLKLGTGFLLYGPPGCGKTLVAKAVANEAGANFIHIQGPELLSKYVGESESAVRKIFSHARTCSPCIIFFDEIDALTTRRGNEGAWVVQRLVIQLMLALSEPREGVYVIGATNRPEDVDHALLRPGRLGSVLYVPLPSPEERGMILKALARNTTIDPAVDLMAIGRNCEDFSGADLSALINEAVLLAYEELESDEESSCMARVAHFSRAMKRISPSVSKEQIMAFEKLNLLQRW